MLDDMQINIFVLLSFLNIIKYAYFILIKILKYRLEIRVINWVMGNQAFAQKYETLCPPKHSSSLKRTC